MNVLKNLEDLACDINPVEIGSQIQDDTLGRWCKAIQTEIKWSLSCLQINMLRNGFNGEIEYKDPFEKYPLGSMWKIDAGIKKGYYFTVQIDAHIHSINGDYMRVIGIDTPYSNWSTQQTVEWFDSNLVERI